MQASTRPSPAWMSPQCCFTSAAHALTFTALTKTSLQGSDRSLTFVLRHSLILPPPACTPGHSFLASLKQAPVNSAEAMEDGSNNTAARKRELVVAIKLGRVVM